MLNIAILGCGQIGSRHLQSLAMLEESAVIDLVDSSAESIEISKKRFSEVLTKSAKSRLRLEVRDLDNLRKNYDFAIIASGSDVRAGLTRKLLLNTKVNTILFEKFLFKQKSDYEDIAALLKSSGTLAWVNQWVGASYAFKRMQQWLQQGRLKPIDVTLNGKDWGLACNAVHFIDLFDRMNNLGSIELVSCNLSDKPVPSKRQGYFEVTGELVYKSTSGGKLVLNSKAEETDGLIQIGLQSAEREVKVILSRGEIIAEYHSNGNVRNESYALPMQSSVTARLIQEIQITGACALPSYSRSSYHHLLLFSCLQPYFENISSEYTGIVPVT